MTPMLGLRLRGIVAAPTLRGCVAHSLSTSAAASSPPQAKREVSATVIALDDEGDAVATTDATPRPLRVPFAVPGDALRVEIWDKDAVSRHTQHPMFAQLVAVETPGAHRVDAPCAKFFGVCGGCKHQNVAYAQQLVQKQRRVEQLFPGCAVRTIRGVPRDDALFRYRNKMEFTCSTGRWLLESDMEDGDDGDDADAFKPAFTLGMFPVSSVGTRRARMLKKRRAGKRAQWNARILSIDACVLQSEACDALLARIRALCEELAIDAYDFDAHDGFLKLVVLRRGVVDGVAEIMIGFVTTTFDGEQQRRFERLVQSLVDEQTESSIGLVSIIQRLDDEALRHRVQKGEVAADALPSLETEHVLFGRDFFHDSILDHTFQVSFDSFFQPNSVQASALYAAVRDELARTAGGDGDGDAKPVVWDLFCGVGSIGICMGPHVRKLIGFELVDAAVLMARRNAAINGYADKMEFHRLDLTTQWSDIASQLERLRDTPATRPDVIIVDPPRAGLHKKLVALLRRLAPPRICYVSCNPATQARDFELLTADSSSGDGHADAAYTVDFLQPVDMLPHTPHIETVAWLTRRRDVSSE